MDDDLRRRAARHAALGDPVRLGIVEELHTSDRSPVELRRLLGLESNLLAHHLDALEGVGLVHRSRSSGDGRRRYVHLLADALPVVGRASTAQPGPALFVCTRNSARSQLAAALWQQRTGQPARSAGTRPADRIHPGAVAAARRASVPMAEVGPRRLAEVDDVPAIVVTVCDQAHEELDPDPSWWHWSITDPVADGSPAAFDRAVVELRGRIERLVPVLDGAPGATEVAR